MNGGNELKAILLIPAACAGLVIPWLIAFPPKDMMGALALAGVAHVFPAAMLYAFWQTPRARGLGHSVYVWTALIAAAYAAGFGMGIWFFLLN